MSHFSQPLPEAGEIINQLSGTIAELRAALAKEKERADQNFLEAFDALGKLKGVQEELAAERQRAEKAEAERDAFDREWPGIMATKRKLIAERDALCAEVERLKASCALKHSDFGKLEMEWAHARATLAERDAKASEMTSEARSLRERLREREAEIERLEEESAKSAHAAAMHANELFGALSEARAALATARAEALEDAAHVVDRDVSNDWVRATISDRIRALAGTNR